MKNEVAQEQYKDTLVFFHIKEKLFGAVGWGSCSFILKRVIH